MEDWKLGYHRALLDFLGVADREIIDLYSMQTFVDHEEGYYYSEVTYENPYTHMRVEWQDPTTGRTTSRYMEQGEIVSFLQSL